MAMENVLYFTHNINHKRAHAIRLATDGEDNTIYIWNGGGHTDAGDRYEC